MGFEDECTIVIKTIYRLAYLKKTINGFRKFYKNVKIIILDDGEDSFVGRTRLRGEKNIDYISTQPDIGVSAGRNVLLSFVKTPYVFLTDDDDILLEPVLDKMLDMLKNSDYEVLGANIDEKKLIIEEDSELVKLIPEKTSSGSDIIPTDVMCNVFIARTEKVMPWLAHMKVDEHFVYSLIAKRKGVKWGVTPFEVKYLKSTARPNSQYNKLRNRFYEGTELKKMGIKKYYGSWKLGRKLNYYDLDKPSPPPDNRLSEMVVLYNKESYIVDVRTIERPRLLPPVETGWRFAHVPKTGGTSIEMAALANGIHWGGTLLYEKIHCPPWTGEEYPENCKIFSIVRHPYKRLISAIKHKHRTDLEQLTNKMANELIKKFILNKGGHFRPQTDITHGKRRVDKIFKYEEGFDKIQQFFDEEKIPIKLENIKIYDTSSKKITLTRETKNIIYKYHKKDFDTYGYER